MVWLWTTYDGWNRYSDNPIPPMEVEKWLGNLGRLLRLKQETGLRGSYFEEYVQHLNAHASLVNRRGTHPDSELEAKIKAEETAMNRLLQVGRALQSFPRSNY